MKQSPASEIVSNFFNAIAAADRDRIIGYLDENLIGYITQADGSAARIEGRDSYMTSIDSLDIATVRPRLTITQIAEVTPDQIMVMAEIEAERKGRALHNFAAYLMTITDGRISRIHMVEARPAESDAFWKS